MQSKKYGQAKEVMSETNENVNEETELKDKKITVLPTKKAFQMGNTTDGQYK